MTQPLRHIVLITLRPGADLDKAVRRLDTRNGPLIVENGLFASRDAFRAWHASEPHQQVQAYLSGVAGW
jgi:hypothetical protein